MIDMNICKEEERLDEIFQDKRKKFLNAYKAGDIQSAEGFFEEMVAAHNEWYHYLMEHRDSLLAGKIE